MDFATFFGIIVGFSLIIGAIFIGGAVDTFVNVPGVMIVLGGTMAATSMPFGPLFTFLPEKASPPTTW